MNFWQPSGGDAFRALARGEPFFFRLKKPHFAIAGFGLFARHEVVTAKLAWEAFGERNGAADFVTMCARIEKYRRGQAPDPMKQHKVGCLMISQPVFFEEADWIEGPVTVSTCTLPRSASPSGSAPLEHLLVVPAQQSGIWTVVSLGCARRRAREGNARRGSRQDSVKIYSA